MKPALVFLGVCGVCSLAVAEDQAPAPTLPACVHVQTHARYGAVGYDHVVSVENTCSKSAACRVSTDVNPEVIKLTVRPQTEESVVTFRGSPAYEFSATVRCKLID